MKPLNFKLIRRAQVPVAHFARLCGASRASVNFWISGTVKPTGLYHVAANELLSQIDTALKRGRLPLPRMRRDAKFDALIVALNK